MIFIYFAYRMKYLISIKLQYKSEMKAHDSFNDLY